MKILTLGLDSSVIDKNSPVAKRAIEYGKMITRYDVIVPHTTKYTLSLSSSVKIFTVRSWSKIFGLIAVYQCAKKLIEKEGYHVVSVQDQYYLALLGLILARKYKIGSEIQVRGFEKFSGLRRLAAYAAVKRFDSVKTISSRLSTQLVKNFDVDPEKITVAPIYTKREKGLAFKRNFECEDKITLLTLSRLVSVKNISLQFRALKNITASILTDVELLVVGDGPLRSRLESEVALLGLEKNVKFLGWQANVDDYYRKADIFLLTSDSEGWGKVIIEAGSYSLPIIMTNVGCANEVIINDKSGLVIGVNREEELVQAMFSLIDSSELRERLGRGAAKAVNELISKQEVLSLYMKSWHKALK